MRKDKNLVFLLMRPTGFVRKLSFLFSMLFVLCSQQLSAVCDPKEATSEINEGERNITSTPANVSENGILYISDGALVYGMENISYKNKTNSSPKKSKTNKKVLITKTKQKNTVKKNVDIAENKTLKKEVLVNITSTPSQNSFESSKHNSTVATPNSNNSFKAITIHYHCIIFSAQFCEIKAVKYQFSFTPNTIYSHSFTRPPPFMI